MPTSTTGRARTRPRTPVGSPSSSSWRTRSGSTKNPDGSAKKFFSPLAPGYNKVIGGGTSCVPRLGGRTMQELYAGNGRGESRRLDGDQLERDRRGYLPGPDDARRHAGSRDAARPAGAQYPWSRLMPKRTLLIMVAAALVTVIAAALTSTGSDVVLPRSPSRELRRRQGRHRSPLGGEVVPRPSRRRRRRPHRGIRPSSTGTGQQVVPIAPPVVLTGCTVSVRIPDPPRGHTQQTVTVTAVAGAEVKVVASYPRATSTHSELADSTGTAVFNLSIASSPVGVTVGVTATANYRNAEPAACQTSFTPVVRSHRMRPACRRRIYRPEPSCRFPLLLYHAPGFDGHVGEHWGHVVLALHSP